MLNIWTKIIHFERNAKFLAYILDKTARIILKSKMQYRLLLEEQGKDGGSYHRHHTTNHDAQTAHSPLDGTHLHRLRRT